MISSVRQRSGFLSSRLPRPATRRRCHALAGTLLLLLIAAPEARAARVEIILDASGSMRASAGTMSRMDAGKRAVRTTVQALDAGSEVGLRLYGHRLPSEPKEASCRDSELVIPIGRLDRARFVAAVDAAQPLGQTPLAHSLEQAASDFGDVGDEPAVIILVSDGEESCGGDPARVACQLAARGLALTVHTVGFDVDAAAREQLQAVARCTGGEYRDAGNADELATSLQRLTQAALLVDKQSAYGREIRGGDTHGDAVSLEPGVEYRLDHHQRKDQVDFFKVAVGGGQKLVASVQTVEKGVDIEGDSFRETDNPYAGLEVQSPDRQSIGSAIIFGRQHETKSLEVPASHERQGELYVLIGNGYSAQHKDSRFKVELVDRSDAGSGRDAPGSDAEALPIEPGSISGWLHANDLADHFAFTADPAATYGIRVRPQHGEKLLRVTVVDAEGVQVAQADSPNPGAAVRFDDIRFAEGGTAYVRVETQPYRSVSQAIESDYTLELSAEGGSAATAAAAGEEGGEDAEGGKGGCFGFLAFLLFVPLAAAAMVPARRRTRR